GVGLAVASALCRSTTLFRSGDYPDGSVGRYVRERWGAAGARSAPVAPPEPPAPRSDPDTADGDATAPNQLRVERDTAEKASDTRSEEHTSELQSRENLVCRL